MTRAIREIPNFSHAIAYKRRISAGFGTVFLTTSSQLQVNAEIFSPTSKMRVLVVVFALLFVGNVQSQDGDSDNGNGNENGNGKGDENGDDNDGSDNNDDDDNGQHVCLALDDGFDKVIHWKDYVGKTFIVLIDGQIAANGNVTNQGPEADESEIETRHRGDARIIFKGSKGGKGGSYGGKGGYCKKHGVHHKSGEVHDGDHNDEQRILFKGSKGGKGGSYGGKGGCKKHGVHHENGEVHDGAHKGDQRILFKGSKGGSYGGKGGKGGYCKKHGTHHENGEVH